MIPRRSAAQIACVRARTRAAVKRLTLPPAGTRGNQTLLDSGNLVQAPVKRLCFSLSLSLVLGFSSVFSFWSSSGRLSCVGLPAAWFGFVSGWVGCVEASGVPLRGRRVAPLLLPCSRGLLARHVDVFTFSEFAAENQSSRGLSLINPQS